MTYRTSPTQLVLTLLAWMLVVMVIASLCLLEHPWISERMQERISRPARTAPPGHP